MRERTIRNTLLNIEKEEFTVEYWRERFRELHEQCTEREKKILFQILVSQNIDFDSVQWYNDLRNVKRGKASLQKTVTVCEALQLYMNRKGQS